MPPKKSAMKLAQEAIAMIEKLNLPHSQEAFPQEALPNESLKLIRKAQYKQKKYEKAQAKDLLHKATHTTERPRRPETPWIAHVKRVRAELGISYKEALKQASKTYRK
jgi:hypothetical protein